MKRISRRILGWLPPFIVMGIVWHVSSRPAPEIFRTQYIFSQDKFLHVGVYFLLAVCFARALAWEGMDWNRKTLLVATALSAFYGFIDEIHQSFVPERTAEFADWIADLIGASLIWLLSRPLRRLIHWERRAAKPTSGIRDD